MGKTENKIRHFILKREYYLQNNRLVRCPPNTLYLFFTITVFWSYTVPFQTFGLHIGYHRPITATPMVGESEGYSATQISCSGEGRPEAMARLATGGKGVGDDPARPSARWW